MPYDVVVVGGGVGGLTVAALLSARGLSVCLLERQSQVGGCIARIEHGGYEFEPGMGLYTGWGAGEIYDRIFSELRVAKPTAAPIDTHYVVRLTPDTNVELFRSDAELFAELRRAFPECGEQAVEFYKSVAEVASATEPELPKRRRGFLGRLLGTNITSADQAPSHAHSNTALSYATNTSPRFQRFIDSQLKAFLQTGIDRCAFASASIALTMPRQKLYSVENGIAELAERLAASIKATGGVVRLNAPVLRLAYGQTGQVVGVDLLNGETVEAAKAIVSNLTIWDTYGRLIGLNRTPPQIKAELQQKESCGAYVIYATLEEQTISRLPGINFLAAGAGAADENLSDEMTLSVGASSDGKAPVTIKTSSEVEPWFSFQTSEEDYVERDQETLEQLWSKLHAAVPEFGSSLEVIETANPRTYYDQTRRKLGMVMGVEANVHFHSSAKFARTSIENVFMVSDTTATIPTVAKVVESAAALADNLTK